MGEPLKTLTGHTKGVLSVSFSPDGKMLTSGSRDETVRLWDAETGEALNLLTGHTSWVGSVSFSPAGQTLASGSLDGTVRLWDAETGEALQTLTGHTKGVLSIAYSPDGETIASGSEDDTVRLWDAGTGEPLKTLTGHTGYVGSVAYSPDGKVLASGGYGETVRLWSTETGEILQTLTGHTHYVNSVSFSPDGKTLASGSSDGTVLLWKVPPNTPEKTPEDVNLDGVVNIQDLVVVAANLGQTGANVADVNLDGVVNIQDLVLVAAALGTAAAAPGILHLDSETALTKTEVTQWLQHARQLDLTDPTFQHGVRFLERLLAVLTPKETALLPNYPNPFNPETWIPYHLAEAAVVTLTISDIQGRVVRVLALGHQRAGIYADRSRAASWDGRNTQGEPVASGVYFYRLTAGDFTATRKMLIRK